MLEIVYFSLISGLVFEVARTAAAGGQQSILEHPIRGNVSCSSFCPPQKSRDNDIVFCHDNCPDYWNWMISVIFADTSERVNRANDCTEYNFTHVPSNSVIPCSNFRNIQNVTEDVKKFWSRNCIYYFVCVIGKNIDVLSGRNISSITLPSADPTATSSSEQPSQSSILPLFIVPIVLGVLCIALCVGLTALIIHLRRWNLLKQRPTTELALQPAPDDPTDNDASEPDEESHFPVQETANDSFPTGVSSTTPKETYSSPMEYTLALCSDRDEEMQLPSCRWSFFLWTKSSDTDMSLGEGNILHTTEADSY